MRRYLPLTIGIIASAWLAGCAGQSEQHVQFFKPYGPRQVEQGYPGVQIITVSQNEGTPPSKK